MWKIAFYFDLFRYFTKSWNALNFNVGKVPHEDHADSAIMKHNGNSGMSFVNRFSEYECAFIIVTPARTMKASYTIVTVLR